MMDHGKFGFLPLCFIFCLIFGAKAQDETTKKLTPYFAELDSTVDAAIKSEANDSVIAILKGYLSHSDSFGLKPEMDRIGKATATDGRLNIYTWNYEVNQIYKYGCLIQFKDKKDKLHMYVLEDKLDDIPVNKTLSTNEWYGCLYYAVVVKKRRKNTYYTLLGWDGHNHIVGRKVIDVLTFSSRGEPELGASLFKTAKGTQKRVVFEFSATGSMVLVYDEHYKKIIFDHLSPALPVYEGQREYYGSDFTYDGFDFKRGKWVFEERLDPRNKDD